MTADRLLEGGVAPDDAPPGYQDVARALQAAALMASDAPTQEAATAVSAFLHATPTQRTNRMKKWKIAAATLAGGLTLSTGLAAADVLPGPAQDAASSALSHVGIHVPDSDGDATNVTTTEKPEKPEKSADDDTTSTTHPDNHGADVSAVAHDDANVGRDHGAAVCATASAGKCQAGAEHGKSGVEHGQSGEVHGGSSNSSSHSSNAGQGSANAGEGSANSNGNGSSGSSSSGSTSSGGSGSSSSGSSTNSGSSGSSGSSTNSSGGGTSSSNSSN